ncbi:RNA-directed DNA polymerase from mobile element jockey [Trichonephila clavipes]|nr:RNA-directed DNA polymerase from mobile element jockey [Trichonephila clavipes]
MLQSSLSKRSSKYLRLLQCNINGLSTVATRIKLDQILEIADRLHVEIIALQETKLCEQRLLNAKGYNIVRRDRASGGGGLMFLICDVHFHRLPDIGNDTSDLEYLGITVHSKNHTITIKNLYHPPNSQHLDTNREEGLFDDNTIILGDCNAKNTTWGSTITNARGLELSNLVNDKAFLCLNDGTHTFRSNSYGSTDVFDLTFISPGLFPYSSWRVLDNIGSDHLPILVKIDLTVNCNGVKNLHWNFKKADWSLFENISNTLISQEPISDNLEKEWSHFKYSIFTAAKSSIPRGKSINRPVLSLPKIQTLPSNEETNAIISDNGHVSVDAWEAAEALAQHYANESQLAFSSFDKHFARVTGNQVKSCRDRPANNPLFNVDFTLPELSYALQNLDTIKSPGSDSISGDFLSHLGILGRERLLYKCNLSLKITKTVEIGHHYSHS